jgi:glycosyltransferase involved in cell wall biosynthesis
MRILLIGPLPPPLGGATVLFSQLVEELSKNPDLSISVINTARSKISVLYNVLILIRTITRTFFEAPKNDIIGFHASNNGALFFAPFICLICKIYNKPWVFRGFGGYFHEWFQSLPFFGKWVFTNTLLKADAILLETKSSLDFFKKIDPNLPVTWYSNSRKQNASIKYKSNNNATKFIFLGHVSLVKGIAELIEASKQVNNITIDVYGPLKDNFTKDSFLGNINYKGIVQPNLISDVIAEYDALILPSKYQKEGYPGVIIEAFNAGIPVITTNIGAIPEIIDDQSGILIEPGNVKQLSEAIENLNTNSQLYLKLKEGALNRSENFFSSKWTEIYINISSRLVNLYRNNYH